MRFDRRTALSALFSLTLAAGLAGRATGDPMVYSYVVDSGVFRVAEATFVVYEAPSSTKLELVIQTTGVSSWLKGQEVTTMQAEVLPDKDRGHRPHIFELKQQKPDRIRDIYLAFDEAGGVSELTIMSKGRLRQSDVPEELQQGTVDPLTALLRVRHWLQTEPGIGDLFEVTLFDGRKLGKLHVKNLGVDPALNLRKLESKIDGLIGYDDGDRLATLPGEPDNWLSVEAREDDSFIPVEIRTDDMAMPAVVQLIVD